MLQPVYVCSPTYWISSKWSDLYTKTFSTLSGVRIVSNLTAVRYFFCTSAVKLYRANNDNSPFTCYLFSPVTAFTKARKSSTASSSDWLISYLESFATNVLSSRLPRRWSSELPVFIVYFCTYVCFFILMLPFWWIKMYIYNIGHTEQDTSREVGWKWSFFFLAGRDSEQRIVCCHRQRVTLRVLGQSVGVHHSGHQSRRSNALLSYDSHQQELHCGQPCRPRCRPYQRVCEFVSRSRL